MNFEKNYAKISEKFTKIVLECPRTEMAGMERVCDVIIGVFEDGRRPIPQTALFCQSSRQ